MEKFICIKDKQATDFAVGTIATLKEWRKIALNWSKEIESLKTIFEIIPSKYLIDYICDVYDLEIISMNDLTLEQIRLEK